MENLNDLSRAAQEEYVRIQTGAQACAFFSIYNWFVVHFETGKIWKCSKPVSKNQNKCKQRGIKCNVSKFSQCIPSFKNCPSPQRPVATFSVPQSSLHCIWFSMVVVFLSAHGIFSYEWRCQTSSVATCTLEVLYFSV